MIKGYKAPQIVGNRVICGMQDHEENGVKTIQTLGELIPKTGTRAALLSLTPGNSSEFPISFKNLDLDDIYSKGPNDTYCAIWEKHIVFKVYGILKIEESEPVLEITHLVPVRDMTGTWTVMTLLVPIARSEYRYYYRTRGQNNMLQLQWDKMEKEGKRLVNENIDTLHCTQTFV
nr:uncharacterized protein LOC117604204 isoform X2 [Osmia lignaria]